MQIRLYFLIFIFTFINANAGLIDQVKENNIIEFDKDSPSLIEILQGDDKKQFKDSKRNGQGTMTTADGSTYEGEFKDGLPHGRGKLTKADGTIYVGIWENGLVVSNGPYESLTLDAPDTLEAINNEGQQDTPLPSLKGQTVEPHSVWSNASAWMKLIAIILHLICIIIAYWGAKLVWIFFHEFISLSDRVMQSNFQYIFSRIVAVIFTFFVVLVILEWTLIYLLLESKYNVIGEIFSSPSIYILNHEPWFIIG